MSEKTKTLYVETHILGPYGNGPRYAEIEITEADMERIHRLRCAVTSYGMTECRVEAASVLWEEGESFDTENTVMVATNRFVWFRAAIANTEEAVETTPIDIDAIGKEDAKVVFLPDGNDDTWLRSVVNQAHRSIA